MYEVKVNIVHGNLTIPVTIATFERGDTVPDYTRGKAIKFAKQIDKGFAVDVVNVADENNPGAAFGLVYHRDANF